LVPRACKGAYRGGDHKGTGSEGHGQITGEVVEAYDLLVVERAIADLGSRADVGLGTNHSFRAYETGAMLSRGMQ
jgi:hypothetical protein